MGRLEIAVHENRAAAFDGGGEACASIRNWRSRKNRRRAVVADAPPAIAAVSVCPLTSSIAMA